MRGNPNVHQEENRKKNIAWGLFIRRAVGAGRRDPGQLVAGMIATADDIRGVRLLLGESQSVFAGRFGRTGRQCRTWENDGRRFNDRKPNVFLCRYTHRELWLMALAEACECWRIERDG